MVEEIELTLNGSTVRLDADGDDALLFVLRNRLGLRAAHFGCGLEQCGACVVVIEGEARYSCALPVSVVAGKSVATPEALGDDPVGAALLDAFQQQQAGQCGYCLSGILMSAFALLKKEPRPDRDTIVAALDRHLCRCGAHGQILAAVEAASTRLAEQPA